MDMEQFLTDRTQNLLINNTTLKNRNLSIFFLGLIMTKSFKNL